ncbi:YciI family protein [Streptomyces sp. NPDC051940]|uniref:YciI family protein n=1 Tax=Streptomyces sp. NPDC051940 TaxID=3155675 RepID=UPI003440C377
MPLYLSVIRIDENDTPEGGPSEQLMEDMGKLIDEMTKAGVLLDTAGLKPTAEGKRVHLRGGQLSTTDGPFTESKEVIGGYAIFQTKDEAEALEWTKRFLLIHGDQWNITCEVREMERP